MATLRDYAPGHQHLGSLGSLAPGLPGTVPASVTEISPEVKARQAADEEVVRQVDIQSLGETAKGYHSTVIQDRANWLANEEAVRAAAGDTAGAADARRRISALQQEAALYAPKEQDITQLDWDPGRILNYAKGAIGSAAASMQDGVVAGAGLRAAGAAIGALPFGQIPGAVLGAASYAVPFAMNYLSNAGETYNEMAQDKDLMANTTATQRLLSGAGTGVAMGALDTFGDLSLIRRGLGGTFGKVADKALDGGGAVVRTAKDSLLEGGTELAQTGLQKGTLGLLNPTRDTSGDSADYWNALAQGTIGSAPLSGTANTIQGMREAVLGRLGDEADKNAGSKRGDEIDLTTGKTVSGGDVDGETLLRAAGMKGSKFSPEQQARRDLIDGTFDVADDPDQAMAKTIDRQSALIDELGRRGAEPEAARLAEALMEVDPSDPLANDHPAMKAAADFVRPYAGMTDEQLAKAVKNLGAKGRKLSTYVPSNDLGGAVGDVGGIDTSKMPAADQAKFAARQEAMKQIEDNAKNAASLMESAFMGGQGDKRAPVNERKAFRALGEAIASMVHTEGEPTPGQLFTAERYGRILGSMLRGTDLLATMQQVGRSTGAEGSPLFSAMLGSAVRASGQMTRESLQQEKLSRDAAADQMVALIPKPTLTALTNKGVNLQGDDNQRQFMLDGLESFFQDGDGPFTEAKLTAMLGKETLGKLKELFDAPIEPNFESTTRSDVRADADVEDRALDSDDEGGEFFGDGDDATDFDKQSAQTALDKSAPERLVFSHGKKDTAADMSGVFRGAVARMRRALKQGVGLAKADLPPLARLPQVRDDGSWDPDDMLFDQDPDAQDLSLPAGDGGDVPLPANSKLWRVAKYAMDKFATGEEDVGEQPTHAVRLSTATEEMDAQKVPAESRVDMMIGYLAKAGKMSDSDAQGLYREVRRARAAKIATDKVNAALTDKSTKPLRERAAMHLREGELKKITDMLSPEGQGRVMAARQGSSEAERLRTTLLALSKELKVLQAERAESLRGAAGLVVPDGDLDAAAKSFFDERFMVVAEKKTNRDFDKMSAAEVEKLVVGGQERLDAARHAVAGIADPEAREQARRKILAEKGTILFVRKGKEVAVRAGDLVNWSRNALFSSSTDENTDARDLATRKGYLNHLSQGIAALLDSGSVPGDIYTYGWAGRLGKESKRVARRVLADTESALADKQVRDEIAALNDRRNAARRAGKNTSAIDKRHAELVAKLREPGDTFQFPDSFPIKAGTKTTTFGAMRFGQEQRAEWRVGDGRLVDPMERTLLDAEGNLDRSEIAASEFDDGERDDYAALDAKDDEGDGFFIPDLDRNLGFERDQEEQRHIKQFSAPFNAAASSTGVAPTQRGQDLAATAESAPKEHRAKELAKLTGADLVVAPISTDGYAGTLGRAAQALGKLFVASRDADLMGKTVVVSVPGKGRNFGGMDTLIKRVKLALDRGAAVRTDNEANATRPHNAVGEGALRQALLAAGYVETPGKLFSTWRAAGTPADAQVGPAAPVQDSATGRAIVAIEQKLAELQEKYKALGVSDHPIAQAMAKLGFAREMYRTIRDDARIIHAGSAVRPARTSERLVDGPATVTEPAGRVTFGSTKAERLATLWAGMKDAQKEFVGRFNRAQIRAFERKLSEADALRAEGHKLRAEIDALEGSGDRKLSTYTPDAESTENTAQERPNPVTQATPSEGDLERVRTHLARMLGDKIKVVFEKTFDAQGEWIEADKTIKLAISSITPMLSTANHEALHAFFSEILKHNPEARDLLLGLVQNPRHLDRLEGILAQGKGGNKAAIASMRSSPEEALAYTFQFWAEGILPVDKKPQGVLEKIQRFLREVFGLVRDSEKALDIFQALYDGKMAEPSAAQKALDGIMAQGERGKRARMKADRQVEWLRSVAMTSHHMMRNSGSATMRDIAAKFFTNPGSTKLGTEPGILNRRDTENKRWSNELQSILNGLSAEDLASMAQHDNERKWQDHPDPGLNRRLQALYALTHRFRNEYLLPAGIELGMRDVQVAADGQETHRYTPMVWDVQALVGKKDEFSAMLLQEKYAGTMGELLATMRQSKPEAEMDDVVDAIFQLLIDRNGVEEAGKLDAQREDGVLSPFFAAENVRKLDWLDPADRGPFLSQDLIYKMSAYLHQGVRAAEYVRTWGPGGKLLKELLQRKGDVVGFSKDGPITADEDGPVMTELRGAAAKEKVPADQVEAWVQRRYEDETRAIGAQEGVLGKNIGDNMRKLNSGLMAYQNARLLPLAIFASMLDPNNILVSGGKLDDMIYAYVRGMKSVWRNWKNLATGTELSPEDDRDALNAMAVGAIDNTVFLERQGNVQASEYLTGAAHRFNSKFFLANGLTMWDRQMRVSATRAGMAFIERNLRGEDKDSERKLQALGLTAEQAVLGKDGKLVVDAKVLATQRAAKKAGEGWSKATPEQRRQWALNELKQAREDLRPQQDAVKRFVQRSVLSPNAAQRPAWASDPHFASLFHLKSFTYSFQETILTHAAEEAEAGNYRPGMQLLAGIPIMIAADITKALITGGGSLPGYMANWGVADWVMHGFGRAGLGGIGEIGMHGLGDPTSLLGPSVDQAWDTVTNAGEKFSNLDMVPGLRILRPDLGLDVFSRAP